MTKTTTLTATLIVALSAALISGCTPTGPSVVAPTAPAPTVSSTVEPTAEPTEAPAEAEIVVGGTVDEATARELNREFKDTVSAYQLSDGSFVVVDREQPLPEPVKAEIGAKVTATTDHASIMNSIKIEEQATGRKILAAAQISASCEPFGPEVLGWYVVSSKTAVAGCFGSRDAAIEAAAALAAERGEGWEVAY